jgi:ATP/maltotriose-dependent transcriptional regulator MalT
MSVIMSRLTLFTTFIISLGAAAAADPERPPQLAASCLAQPTSKCLLADAQVAAMRLTDTQSALPNLIFIGWIQALTGDRDAALDTLRVSELRAIGAAPELLGAYHAARADVWIVLKEDAKAKDALAAAVPYLAAADDYSRAFTLADIGYAQALSGDSAAAAASNAQAIELARGPGGDAFQLAYVGWNQILGGEPQAGLSTIHGALEALQASATPDEWLLLWTRGYAAIGDALVGVPAASASRDRLQQAIAGATDADTRLSALMMLAYSYSLSGDHDQAAAILREQLPNAYSAQNGDTRAISLGYAALAMAQSGK